MTFSQHIYTTMFLVVCSNTSRWLFWIPFLSTISQLMGEWNINHSAFVFEEGSYVSHGFASHIRISSSSSSSSSSFIHSSCVVLGQNNGSVWYKFTPVDPSWAAVFSITNFFLRRLVIGLKYTPHCGNYRVEFTFTTSNL